eukprot:CAMPEP_0170525260 /NCGR_PEP_ID=MMETSP0209-20121228/10745_1 /TAXON_ID=665100 ORGANISM="Litonotus pictus, Strain P1" /NCGR_SAMPLE_ID=MMETSP0209 /ASSEMBLY_ACC=CAM_ASM_000301 /LENGTH=277 /DNA_ID=CAMNT_0010814427 /DNA_START=312 /DNA_END=1145 /DNA_ORIENTATION=+
MIQNFEKTIHVQPKSSQVHFCSRDKHHVGSEDIALHHQTFKASQLPDFRVRDNIDIVHILDNQKLEVKANNPLAYVPSNLKDKEVVEVDHRKKDSDNGKDLPESLEKDKHASSNNPLTNNEEGNKTVDNLNVNLKGTTNSMNITKTTVLEESMIKNNLLKTKGKYSRVIDMDNRKSLKFKDPVVINLHEKKIMKYIQSARFKQELYEKKLAESQEKRIKSKRTAITKEKHKQKPIEHETALEDVSAIHPTNQFRATVRITNESFYDKIKLLKTSLIS